MLVLDRRYQVAGDRRLTASPASSRATPAGARPQSTVDPLDRIEGRWVLDILLSLNEHEHRFSDLRTAIPRVSANILTDRLRALEHAGLVERRNLPPPAASQVYALAEAAEGLRPALDALASWRAEEVGTRLPERGAAAGALPPVRKGEPSRSP